MNIYGSFMDIYDQKTNNLRSYLMIASYYQILRKLYFIVTYFLSCHSSPKKIVILPPQTQTP